MNPKLIFTIVCVALASLLTDAAPASRKFGKLDAIPYEVLNKTDEFEIRRYPSFRYAEASESGVGMKTATSRNFRKLFSYITGNNEEKQKIPMTVPVLCPLEKDSSGGYAQNYNMMFWLPQKYQSPNHTPKPSSDQVRITMWGERIAYVRSYGWWATESLIKKNENKLRESLDAAGVKAGVDYDPSMVYSASYNSPWEIFGRHNEVMFMQMQHSNDATAQMQM